MNVGDYVRTKYGKIGRIIAIGKNIVGTTSYLVEWSNCRAYYVSQVKDYKSSPNIIDLIEVGDYVNGYKVTMLEDEYYDDATDSVKKIKDKEKIKIILGNEEQFYGIYAKDIKSIVTKEQFESMEYKVGE